MTEFMRVEKMKEWLIDKAETNIIVDDEKKYSTDDIKTLTPKEIVWLFLGNYEAITDYEATINEESASIDW